MKQKLLVSSCLLGEMTRYDGRSVPNEAVISLCEKYDIISACPECLGGLPTPRVPSERVKDSVVMKDGRDVTEEFCRGARAALELCLKYGITVAVLKERSPSCGYGEIYDGSFEGRLTEGVGVTAELLSKNGIRVIGESRIGELLD